MKKISHSGDNWFKWAVLGVVVLYLVTHLIGLTSLPVFADESIYIRWSQLIMDEPIRYAFFPLNDGKTPLFVWLMIPFQYVFSDQLWAARLVAVLVGLAQIGTMAWLAKLLGGKKPTQILVMIMTTILPYWYFHHRMALMDGIMTLWLSLAMAAVLKISARQAKSHRGELILKSADYLWTALAGVFFGLALWSKLPAVLFAPVFAGTVFLIEKNKFKNIVWSEVKVGAALAIGVIIFLLLKLHPAFGQLFSRGSDFLFPLSEVLAGAWQETIISFPNYLNYFVNYLTLPAMVIAVAALFSPWRKKMHHVLLWLALLYILPIAIMGKTVYPRYLLPGSIFLTLSAALAFESFYLHLETKKHFIKRFAAQIILVLLLGNMLAAAGSFVFVSIFDADHTPFVSADKVQYLYEWSSGHGVKDAVAYIENVADTQTVAVATEGYFGTLPDAVLMYLHRRDVTNLYVGGIGQPVFEIPDVFLEKSKNFERQLLVVNSHRMMMNLDSSRLLAEYCRPDKAPCLQIWDVGNLPSSTP